MFKKKAQKLKGEFKDAVVLFTNSLKEATSSGDNAPPPLIDPPKATKPPRSKLIDIQYPGRAVFEVTPSKITSNTQVRWLMAEVSRLYKSVLSRVDVNWDTKSIQYMSEYTVWWEIYLSKDKIRFHFVFPDEESLKIPLSKQVMKIWKQSNVVEVKDYMPNFDTDICDITTLTLEHHSILSLDTDNPTYSPLESVLNARHYLLDKDEALLQIGLQPLGEGWNELSEQIYKGMLETGIVPRKKGKALTGREVFNKGAICVGLVMEETMNLLGDFLLPGWQDSRSLGDSLKIKYKEGKDRNSTRNKIRSEAFKTVIRVVASSENEERRKSIIRSLSCGFDPLQGDNRLVEKPIPTKQLDKYINNVKERRFNLTEYGDVLCSLELAKIIQVPDQKAQIEHYNELSVITNRSESDIPREIFINDGTGIPFIEYTDSDGQMLTGYISAKSYDWFCMTMILIGEPGSGKTTLAVSMAVDLFLKGFGAMCIDAADGKMIQKILDRIPPNLRSKVKIVDFLNTAYPIGLGWNEAFKIDPDLVEDLLVTEVITYIELVAETELNMTAKQWVENAVKAVFVTPDATLQDVENMIANATYRDSVIPTIEDPQLRADWEYFHAVLKPEERKSIYDQSFRRLSPVIRKKALKNFVLQRPKKDESGNYIFDMRKWMDEGYLVLVKANETLGEDLQTALVSFLLAKLNLATISREDIPNEDDRHPFFVFLDEPDHYIKGSERWRNMLTRYRKYRVGLKFMFHGWQQLVETDKNLPKIIRKAGPHYIVYHTDLENMLELKPVIEPEFKIADLVKGMPRYHAVIKMNMYKPNGEPMPPFMAKAITPVDNRYKYYDNNDLYQICAEELGRPKKDVMNDIYKGKTGNEFDGDRVVNPTGEGDVDMDNDESKDSNMKGKKIDESAEELENKKERNRKARMVMEYQVSQFIEEQIAKGEDPDLDLIEHIDELLEEG